MEPVSAVLGGAQLASSIFGGLASKKANKKAAAALAALRQQISDQWTNNVAPEYQPYIDLGAGATNNLEALNNGDYSGFENSPDYQFAKQEGTRALDASAVSKGIYGTGYGRQLQKYGQGLATQTLGNYRTGQYNNANLGKDAVNGKEYLYGSDYLSQLTGLATGGIQANANASMALPNAISAGINGLSNSYGMSQLLNSGNLFTQGTNLGANVASSIYNPANSAIF